MPLDPIIKGLLDQMADPNAPALSDMTPADARAGFAALAALQGEPEAVAVAEDRRIPGPASEVPVRVYRPQAEGTLPALVYFHGGGWVLMDVNSHDGVCRALANAVGCAVISVDYRLAPEAKYPAAPDDCYAALQWVHDNAADLKIDTSRIALAGDSAGANLAAVVAQMARDRKGPSLVYQVLHCPVTNHDYGTASYRDNSDDYMLTKDSMEWFWDHYLANTSDGQQPYASPLLAKDLSGLPPALVQTAEFDPLRDEGKAYADALQAAGVETTYHNYDGLIHDTWLFFGVVPAGRQNLDEAAEHLKRAFAG